MKKTSCYLLAATCLAGLAPFLRAHDRVLAQTATHDHVLFSGVETTITMLDDGLTSANPKPAKVVARWEMAKPGTGGSDQAPLQNTYKVTISLYEPGTTTALVTDKIYSLLSLGIQPIANETEIFDFQSSGTAALIENPGNKTPLTVASKTVYRIPRTGTRWNANWGRDVLISENVWLVKLSGAAEFTFWVRELKSIKPGVTRWDNGTTSPGHDNTPPKNPPD